MRRCWITAALMVMAIAATSPGQSETPGFLDDLLDGANRNKAVKVEVFASQDKVRPGDSFQIAVVVTPLHPFHINSNRPLDQDYVATVVSLQAEGITVKSIAYPPGVLTGIGANRLDLYVERTVIVATLTASDALSGETLAITGKLDYQACEDLRCLRPTFEPISLNVTIAPAGSEVVATHAELFVIVSQPAVEAETEDGGGGVFDALNKLLTGGNVAVQLVAMFLLGLCINLTGCTLPSLALTVGFFSNQAEGKIGRQVTLAAAFSAGMLAFFAVMGGISVGIGVGFSAIYQYPMAVGALVAIIVVFSGSLFGFYTLSPPKAIYKVAGGHTGLMGAFGMGLVAVVIAIPCTAGFLVGIMGYCANLGGNWPLIIGVWLLVGLGMSAPFVILAMIPTLTKRVPRGGDWTELIKKGFGFVLLIVAAYQAKSMLPPGGFEVITGAIIFAWGTFIALYGWDKIKHPAGRAAVLVIGILVVAIAIIGFLLPNVGGTEAPHAAFVDHSPQVIARAKADGRPVLIKVTAKWCSICQEQERTIYRDPRVIAESRRPGGVLFVKADVTLADSPARREMHRLGTDAPPMTLFYDSSGKEVKPRLANYTTEQLLERIRKLRGEP